MSVPEGLLVLAVCCVETTGFGVERDLISCASTMALFTLGNFPLVDVGILVLVTVPLGVGILVLGTIPLGVRIFSPLVVAETMLTIAYT